MSDRLISAITHPKGFLCTITTFIIGYIPTFEKSTKDDVTFIFQNMAFVISMLVGILTGIHLICKLIDWCRNNRAAKSAYQQEQKADEDD